MLFSIYNTVNRNHTVLYNCSASLVYWRVQIWFSTPNAFTSNLLLHHSGLKCSGSLVYCCYFQHKPSVNSWWTKTADTVVVLYLHKNSQTVKKTCSPCKKSCTSLAVLCRFHFFCNLTTVVIQLVFLLLQTTAKQDELTPAKLSTGWLNCDLTLAELSDLTLVELSTWWLDSNRTVLYFSWTIYWVTWLKLNCLLVDLTLAELSTGWLESNWTVYWLTWLWLNCILGDLALAELYVLGDLIL